MSWRPTTPSWVMRAGLVLLAFPSAVIAGWGLTSPRSLLRQLSRRREALGLGAAPLQRAPAPRLRRRVARDRRLPGRRRDRPRAPPIQIALIAFLAYSIPHFAYHLTTTEHYSTGDNVGSLGGFVVTIVLAGFLLALTRPTASSDDLRSPIRRDPTEGGSGSG